MWRVCELFQKKKKKELRSISASNQGCLQNRPKNKRFLSEVREKLETCHNSKVSPKKVRTPLLRLLRNCPNDKLHQYIIISIFTNFFNLSNLSHMVKASFIFKLLIRFYLISIFIQFDFSIARLCLSKNKRSTDAHWFAKTKSIYMVHEQSKRKF